MKGFWTDRIALSFAMLGIILMAFALAWRVNPVEGAVIPRYFLDNPAGVAVFWVLFVTCMPVWIVAMTLPVMLFGDTTPDWLSHWLPNWRNVSYAGVLLLQGAVYFLIGKGTSACARRFRTKPPSTGQGA